MKRYKVCNGKLCKGAVLPITAFYTRSNGKPMSPCKACKAAKERARYLKNRAHILAQKQEYTARNKERIGAYTRKHYRQNRARLLAALAKYRAKHRDQLRVKDAEYRAKNRTVINERKRIQNKRRKLAIVLQQHGIGG